MRYLLWDIENVLNRTSEMAIRALLLLGLEQGQEPMSPKALATRLDCSASYLRKTLALLTRAGILESVRGAHGGVLLRKDANEITLQHIVEACQGVLIGNYCRKLNEPAITCGFHTAMEEIYQVTIAALARWSLADMLVVPVQPSPEMVDLCRMYFNGCERLCATRESE